MSVTIRASPCSRLCHWSRWSTFEDTQSPESWQMPLLVWTTWCIWGIPSNHFKAVTSESWLVCHSLTLRVLEAISNFLHDNNLQATPSTPNMYVHRTDCSLFVHANPVIVCACHVCHLHSSPTPAFCLAEAIRAQPNGVCWEAKETSGSWVWNRSGL